MSMMVYMGISPRYIPIADPDRYPLREVRSRGERFHMSCRPIAGVKDIFGGYVFHATISPNCKHQRIQRSTWICQNSIRRTGHKTLSSVLPWMTVSCFEKNFCISSVIATLSADSKLLDCVGMSRPSLKKQTFLRHKSLVCFCSRLGTLEYSQGLQAKEAAPMVSCVIDLSVSVT